ncbi:MAG: heme ABC exporter ATP-binding protein CcmA, partial [Nevskiaceae bacterium]
IARGDQVLLRGLRGEVAPGEILHLRGANGVGKTTLLEVLCGLRAPESGSVTLAFEPDACHWIGHRNALNGALSPFENLRFWCALQGAPDVGIRGALREFDLARVADQPCRQLSAGQNRRAALARLAIVRRAVWFCDEPLSGLDEAGIRHWLALLEAHQRQGGAAVITSHQPLPAQLPGMRTMELS